MSIPRIGTIDDFDLQETKFKPRIESLRRIGSGGCSLVRRWMIVRARCIRRGSTGRVVMMGLVGVGD